MNRKDKPWVFRTYAGHTSARASNALFHTNLKAGQTGLSVAFDLPTQTGYDPDHLMAKGEVGKVGVPIAHLGDMRTLLDGIPVAEMNTSMTINATAMWLLALYISVADEQGTDRSQLQGTTQNDILKEYLSRGTFIFPPGPSMKLIVDMVVWTLRNTPKWNPINVCSYHLQEAGADPVLEVAITLANAIAVLDAVRETGEISEEDFGSLVGRISFFLNSGIRIVEETCKMRVFTRMWDRITKTRYGVDDPKFRRFRYGIQVNSLGLTAHQAENNVYRILLETLPATISKNARARAVQLPAWNEALGLPRPWDQQWSLRAQQIVALETDLLEFEDIFEGSKVIEEKTSEIEGGAEEELQRILEMGGSLQAIDYMKEQLVSSHARRQRAIESGEMTVVGVNSYTESVPSPLLATFDENSNAFLKIDPEAEAEEIDRLTTWRQDRDNALVTKSLDHLKQTAEDGGSLMEPSIDAAKAGVTTGEWADALREVFGEYRAPTGVSERSLAGAASSEAIQKVREAVRETAEAVGSAKLRLLVAKPGLDGHSNAAEQVAVRARDVGFEVIYQGIRLTPDQIARAAVDEDVHAVGVSILSGAHNFLVAELLERLRENGIDPATTPVIVGGVIPDDDAKSLLESGVARVYTPRDYDLTLAMADIAGLIRTARGA
ncbi:MAG: protein meaA [Actinobacteria bacterium]|nr:protein meaA [Actinomycetota bacterium]